MKKIVKPKISYLEENKFNMLDIKENSLFESETLENIILKKSKFDECSFNKVELTNSDISHSSFVDLIFKNSDLSNTNLEFSSFHRIRFEECRLIGVDFSNSSLNDITFVNCKLDYSNFSSSRLKNVEFVSCELIKSSFIASKLDKDIVFFDTCNLEEAEFLDTSLNSIDLSTSNINGLGFMNKDIKGCIVSMEEAIYLSECLGIVIKDR